MKATAVKDEGVIKIGQSVKSVESVKVRGQWCVEVANRFKCKKKKKSETELTASVLKKRSKTHKSLLCVLEVQMYLSLRVD